VIEFIERESGVGKGMLWQFLQTLACLERESSWWGAFTNHFFNGKLVTIFLWVHHYELLMILFF
jgi:hypothetical protein